MAFELVKTHTNTYDTTQALVEFLYEETSAPIVGVDFDLGCEENNRSYLEQFSNGTLMRTNLMVRMTSIHSGQSISSEITVENVDIPKESVDQQIDSIAEAIGVISELEDKFMDELSRAQEMAA